MCVYIYTHIDVFSYLFICSCVHTLIFIEQTGIQEYRTITPVFDNAVAGEDLGPSPERGATKPNAWYIPRPSNYPLVDSEYHQMRTIRFQLRVVGGSRYSALIHGCH